MTKIEKYFSKHVTFNAAVHAVGGVGVGLLLANLLFTKQPFEFGVFFLAVALLGHLYAYMMFKGKK